MAIMQVIMSGNSQAVRMTAEVACTDARVELKMTPIGDVIAILPAPYSLAEAVATLRDLPKPTEVEVREPIDVPERD